MHKPPAITNITYYKSLLCTLMTLFVYWHCFPAWIISSLITWKFYWDIQISVTDRKCIIIFNKTFTVLHMFTLVYITILNVFGLVQIIWVIRSLWNTKGLQKCHVAMIFIFTWRILFWDVDDMSCVCLLYGWLGTADVFVSLELSLHLKYHYIRCCVMWLL